MKRVTQSLFEEIQKVTSGELDEAKLKHDEDGDGDEDGADYMMKRRKAGGQSHAQAHAATRKHNESAENPVDKAHFCATHVEHADHGQGFCISEAHADPDENGDIAWYTVQFAEGVMKVNTSDMTILQAESHMHGKKKKMKEEAEELDEISKKTLGSYINKASVDMANRTSDATGKRTMAGADYAHNIATGMSAKKAKDNLKKDTDAAKPDIKKAVKRMYGIDKAVGRLTKEEVELEEGVSQTIINHNDFVLEITDNPTFADYLAAAKSFVSEEDAVVVAEEFFKEQDESLIIEAFTRADIDAKVSAHQKAGHSVTMPKMSTKNGEPYAEYVVTDKDTKVRRKYIHHGKVRRVENMGTPGKKDRGEE